MLIPTARVLVHESPNAPEHLPAWHDSPTGQAIPQPPQCAAVDWVLTHMPSHTVSPSGHAHLPLVHGNPPVHLVAQSPQWLMSVLGSVQALSHTTSVASAHLH
jgi:hypothetical protein